MGARSLPAVDRTDTPQPCCGEWGVPKTYPQRSPTRTSRASPRHRPVTLGDDLEWAAGSWWFRLSRSSRRRAPSCACWRSGTSNSFCCGSRTTATSTRAPRAGNVGDVAPVPWVETLGAARVTTRMPGRVSSGRRLCASRHLRATILQSFPMYENVAMIPIQEGGGNGRSDDQR
jgi:hypothetical protein